MRPAVKGWAPSRHGSRARREDRRLAWQRQGRRRELRLALWRESFVQNLADLAYRYPFVASGDIRVGAEVLRFAQDDTSISMAWPSWRGRIAWCGRCLRLL